MASIDPPVTGPVLDPETMQRLEELQKLVGNAQDVLGDLARIFAADSVRYLAELHDAVEAADGEAIGRLVHTLKGAALSVGAQRVSSFCLDAEMASRAGTADHRAHHRALTQLVEEARNALHAQAQSGPKPSRG